MMAASRLELNLVRLLCRCEAMAAEKRDPEEWRLEKVREICTVKQSPTPGRRLPQLAAAGPYSPDPTTALDHAPSGRFRHVHLQLPPHSLEFN